MLLYDDDDGQGVERVPLPFAYARLAAPIVGYGTTHRLEMSPGKAGWTRAWYPTPMTLAKTDLFPQSIMATPNVCLISTRETSMSLYLIGDMQFHALLRGHPWSEERLDRLFLAWGDLPHSAQVASAITQKQWWLEKNPGYRGIPVRQSASEARKMGARE